MALLTLLVGGSLATAYLIYADRSFFAPPTVPANESAWHPPEEQVFLPPPPAIPSQSVPMPNGFEAPATTAPFKRPAPPSIAPGRPARHASAG